MRLLYIVLLSFLFIGCSSANEEKTMEEKVNIIKVELTTQQTNYVAGDSIALNFKSDNNIKDAKLHIKNAYGNTLLEPIDNNKLSFNFPENYTKLAGPCRWKLLTNGSVLLNGKVNISTNVPKATYIESYFGPRSITAGRNDFSMLTIAPTDAYDNPLDNGTDVTVKYQFLENISAVNIKTENFIAWYNVASTIKSGRILVTSECNGTTSKELATIVYPSNGTNFKITASSAHKFADGNQILTLKTDIIQDEFGNEVTNGTLVTFVIKNDKNSYLYTIGTTLNGMAEAKTLHPDKESNWEIQGFITGAAESNKIQFNFKSAIKDFPVYFSKGNRNIDIGPFESFMKQLVPDGILLQLDIYDIDGDFIETKKTTTKNGSCTIYLGEHFLPDGNYKLKIKAAGITKEFIKNMDGY